jgi:hypothetical protein
MSAPGYMILNKPPIGSIFAFSLLVVIFSFFGSLLGWHNFYNKRRLLGATLIGGSGLLGGFGFLAWLML